MLARDRWIKVQKKVYRLKRTYSWKTKLASPLKGIRMVLWMIYKLLLLICFIHLNNLIKGSQCHFGFSIVRHSIHHQVLLLVNELGGLLTFRFPCWWTCNLPRVDYSTSSLCASQMGPCKPMSPLVRPCKYINRINRRKERECLCHEGTPQTRLRTNRRGLPRNTTENGHKGRLGLSYSVTQMLTGMVKNR